MSPASFETEVLPHVGKLRERARQFTRRGGDAEDLVQETLLRAWKSWGRVTVANVWGWLWLTMRNVWLDSRRSASSWANAVESHVSEIADVRAVPPPPPDARVTAGVGDECLQGIQQLRGMQRTVIELQLAGIGDEDLARHLRISVKTVRSAACKARARLRATF